MRLLLDSNAFLWWAEADPKLSAVAHSAIADPANEGLISMAALWELVIKASLGKLALPNDVETMATSQGFRCWRSRSSICTALQCCPGTIKIPSIG